MNHKIKSRALRLRLTLFICFCVQFTSFFNEPILADENVIYLNGRNPIENRTLTSGTYVIESNTTFIDENNTAGAAV